MFTDKHSGDINNFWGYEYDQKRKDSEKKIMNYDSYFSLQLLKAKSK